MSLDIAIVIGMIICAAVGAAVGFMSARSFYKVPKEGVVSGK